MKIIMYINLVKKNNLDKIDTFVKLYNLQMVLQNKRTVIWENEFIKIAVDRNVIRVCLHDSVKYLVPQVKDFFGIGVRYGKE